MTTLSNAKLEAVFFGAEAIKNTEQLQVKPNSKSKMQNKQTGRPYIERLFLIKIADTFNKQIMYLIFFLYLIDKIMISAANIQQNKAPTIK